MTDAFWGPLDYTSKKMGKLSIRPMETILRFLKELKIKLSCDLAVPLLGRYLEKNMV